MNELFGSVVRCEAFENEGIFCPCQSYTDSCPCQNYQDCDQCNPDAS